MKKQTTAKQDIAKFIKACDHGIADQKKLLQKMPHMIMDHDMHRFISAYLAIVKHGLINIDNKIK